VPEYWLVDLDAGVVECWRPADERPEIVSEILVWHPEPTVPPLSIDLATLFAEVLD
jgi:Uma2 family endonuclease